MWTPKVHGEYFESFGGDVVAPIEFDMRLPVTTSYSTQYEDDAGEFLNSHFEDSSRYKPSGVKNEEVDDLFADFNNTQATSTGSARSVMEILADNPNAITNLLASLGFKGGA